MWKEIIRTGIGMGSALAMILSYSINKSIIWAIIHFLSGFSIMALLKQLNSDNSLILLIILLLIYEAYEFIVIQSGGIMFRVESNLDIIYDLIYGTLGGLFYIKLCKKI